MLKPAILVFDNAIEVTGSVVAATRMADALARDFDFAFVLPAGSKAKARVEKAGFGTYEIPFLEIRRSWKSLFYVAVLLKNLVALKRILRKSNARLMIANDFYNMLPVLYRLLGGSTPYIAFVRFVPSRFPAVLVNTWCFFHYRLAEQVIAISAIVREKLKPHPRLKLIYDGLPQGNDFKAFPYETTSRTLLYLSNYIPGKGQDHAIRAFASLDAHYSEWTLRFVGSDMGLGKNVKYKKSLVALSEKLGVSQRVTWSPFTDEVVTEYRRASVVLNFSDSESFSLTTLEAMLIGRPVIATRSGGPQEMITSGVDGELVEVGHHGQMVSALVRLLSDHDLRKTYAGRAPSSVSSKYSAENTVFRLRPIYQRAIHGGAMVSFS